MIFIEVNKYSCFIFYYIYEKKRFLIFVKFKCVSIDLKIKKNDYKNNVFFVII